MSVKRLGVIAAVNHFGAHYRNPNNTENPIYNNSGTSSAPFYNFPLNANLAGGGTFSNNLPSTNFGGVGGGSTGNGFLLHQGQHNSMRSGLSSGNSTLHGNVNILLGGAMLSVVITILCVVCYCCHRNIKKRTESAYRQRWLDNDANMEIYSVEQCYETSGLFMDEGMSSSHIPTLSHEPPPSYDTVLAMDELLNHNHHTHNSSPPPGYCSTNSINQDLSKTVSSGTGNSIYNPFLRKHQPRNGYRSSFTGSNSSTQRSVGGGNRKNLHFRMLRTESCCSLERALGGCGQSSSSSESNIIENSSNVEYMLEIHNQNETQCLEIQVTNNECSLCGNTTRHNTFPNAQQSPNESLTDSGFENLIQIDLNRSSQQQIKQQCDTCECATPLPPLSSTENLILSPPQLLNQKMNNVQILPSSSSFLSTCSRNNMNSSESDQKLTSVYMSCTAMDVSRDSSSENISLMDLNESDHRFGINLANSNNLMQNNDSINNNNEILNYQFNNNSETNLNNNHNNLTFNNNMRASPVTTSATSDLDTFNENGIIRMDMSQIIDISGLPTYEAALKLESSGYV